MTLGRYTALFLGDLMQAGADCIMSHTDKARLKCDFLQVGHHGYGGGSDALHRAVAPKYLLWPCPDFWFHTVRLWGCNDYLIHSEDIAATFVSGQAEYTFDLDAPIPMPTPYPGDTLRAPLEARSACVLGWSCLTGGISGYAPARISFDGVGCTLTAGDAYTLCQLVQRGQLATGNYTFSFSGSVKHAAVFGLMFDNPHPMTWAEEAFVPLPIKDPFSFRLEVDRAKRTARLFDGQDLLRSVVGIGEEPADIILVLKDAVVELNSVTAQRKPKSTKPQGGF